MSLEKEKGVSGEEEKGKETYFLKWTFFCFFLGGGYGLVALPCGLVISVTH